MTDENKKMFLEDSNENDKIIVESEVNDKPSLVQTDGYETLSEKIHRFSAFGFPHVSDSEYSDSTEESDLYASDILSQESINPKYDVSNYVPKSAQEVATGDLPNKSPDAKEGSDVVERVGPQIASSSETTKEPSLPDA